MLDFCAMDRSKRRWRRLWTTPLALALHVGLLAVATATSYVAVGLVQDPDVRIVFLSFAPPAPPPPAAALGRGGPQSKPARSQPQTDGPPLSQPETSAPQIAKDLLPAPMGSAEGETGSPEGVPGGSPDGIPGGDPDGQPGGVPGGTGGGEPGGAKDLGAPRAPIYVTELVEPPVLVHRVDPEYPETARRARVSGKVILQAVISENGAVEGVQVLKGHPLLQDAAVSALRLWRYKPAVLDGRPVQVYFTVVVTFSLV